MGLYGDKVQFDEQGERGNVIADLHALFDAIWRDQVLQAMWSEDGRKSGFLPIMRSEADVELLDFLTT